ncbi:hypothetical protein Vretimale_13401 [Volvox reticuliferus]|uniref:Uncharacterized protein n=1 Tax=Volvox reticuliferus TaxID=1737510 RepID=A0A8J4CS03_9CHLO|nr:hypothetical protein Vretifemale_14014 [Volvox reticuliferus]GIM09546.1 hypothetical protein Vretimale_13401 [Volvox reticuliferus]
MLMLQPNIQQEEEQVIIAPYIATTITSGSFATITLPLPPLLPSPSPPSRHDTCLSPTLPPDPRTTTHATFEPGWLNSWLIDSSRWTCANMRGPTNEDDKGKAELRRERTQIQQPEGTETTTFVWTAPKTERTTKTRAAVAARPFGRTVKKT